MNNLKKLEDFEKQCAVEFLSHIRFNFYNRKYDHNILSFYIEHRFLESIDDYVDITGVDNHGSGVYMINNFYIGKSKNLKKRFAQHLMEALYEPDKINSLNLKPLNKEKIENLRNFLSEGKLTIEILDDDLTKESIYIKDSKLNLTNSVCKNKKLKE